MRGDTEEVGKNQIMEDFVFLHNNEYSPYPREDMELLNDFKPQTEIISMAGEWIMVLREVYLENRKPRS